MTRFVGGCFHQGPSGYMNAKLLLPCTLLSSPQELPPVTCPIRDKNSVQILYLIPRGGHKFISTCSACFPIWRQGAGPCCFASGTGKGEPAGTRRAGRPRVYRWAWGTTIHHRVGRMAWGPSFPRNLQKLLRRQSRDGTRTSS